MGRRKSWEISLYWEIWETWAAREKGTGGWLAALVWELAGRFMTAQAEDW